MIRVFWVDSQKTITSIWGDQLAGWSRWNLRPETVGFLEVKLASSMPFWTGRNVMLLENSLTFLHWFFYLYRRSLGCADQHELHEPAYANGMLHGSHCLECADFSLNHDC